MILLQTLHTFVYAFTKSHTTQRDRRKAKYEEQEWSISSFPPMCNQNAWIVLGKQLYIPYH